MTTTAPDIAQLRASGLAALQSGDAATSRARLQRVLELEPADALAWAALAMACQALGDIDAMDAAADRALAIDAANLPALVLKGDRLLARGDARTATAYYGVAVALAGQAGRLNDSLLRMVNHAATSRDRINDDIARHLQRSMRAAGCEPANVHPRFAQAFDLLTGRRRRYLPQPRAFFYPGLPDTQFYDRAAFPWLDAVEAATASIVEELQAVERRGESFEPYVRHEGGGPLRPDRGMLGNPQWTAHFLWKDGAPVPGHAAHCPRTLAALEGVPLARIPGRGPSILFSCLRPGARIAPHTGFLNCRLIVHLPLVVPSGCGFRVGNERRSWCQGHAWVFNDTIEHEAWNDGSEARIVLIFDVWHPELCEEERGLIALLMQAIDGYENSGPARSG